MAAQEELKIMPFGDIWQEYLNRENVAADYVSEVMDYERKYWRHDNERYINSTFC